ncbi:MAG: hypothetical protein N2654_07245 [Deltaproteobacteria bacterium]|nr:hypothetical protein [Deltaproteobacteria bacterium]
MKSRKCVNKGLSNLLKQLGLLALMPILISQPVCYTYHYVVEPSNTCDLTFRDINDRGQVLMTAMEGDTFCYGKTLTYVFDYKTAKTKSISNKHELVVGLDLNNSNQVVGYTAKETTDDYYAFRLFAQNGKFIKVFKPLSGLTKINEKGLAVGYRAQRRGRSTYWVPFVNKPVNKKFVSYDVKRVLVDKNDTGFAWIRDLNDNGVLAGEALRAKSNGGRVFTSTDRDYGLPVVWSNHKRDPRVLILPGFGVKPGSALKINNDGDILGFVLLSRDFTTEELAWVVWKKNGGILELMIPADIEYEDLELKGLTEGGLVFANLTYPKSSDDEEEQTDAVLWDDSGNFFLLKNALIADDFSSVERISYVYDVSPRGFVLAEILQLPEDSDEETSDDEPELESYTVVLEPVSCD